MRLEQFKEEFEVLHGYYDRNPKASTIKAWFREMESWDFDLFKQVVEEFTNAQSDRDGKIFFPHIGTVISAYHRIKRGGIETGEVESCPSCDHGKIYMEWGTGNGVWSQPYVFRCGECEPWQFKQFQPMCPARLDEYTAKGWRLDNIMQSKWDSVKAGTWKEEDEKLSPAKVGGLLRGMGIGKENADREAKRQRHIDAVEQSEVPF